MIANYYGLSPTDVTDEFIKARRQNAKAEAKMIYTQHEVSLGVKLKPDSPEYRRETLNRAQKIMSAKPMSRSAKAPRRRGQKNHMFKVG